MRFYLTMTIALLATASGAAAATAAPQDKSFLTDAMKGDNSEMTLGKMAQRQAGSADTRSFGATLAADHAKAKAQVAALARRDRVAVTSEITPEAREEKMKLLGLKGAAFDREFARYMVDDHQKDIAKFETEAKRGSGPVPMLARQQLPTLRKHLAMAEQLDKR
jgi:putative membrane protein